MAATLAVDQILMMVSMIVCPVLLSLLLPCLHGFVFQHYCTFSFLQLLLISYDLSYATVIPVKLNVYCICHVSYSLFPILSLEDEESKQKIIDQTETNLVALRRTIYLTLQSSLDYEEAAHKLLKLQLKPGQEGELCNMILDCGAQQRTYEKFYGFLAQVVSYLVLYVL